jgi:hypothetical protein
MSVKNINKSESCMTGSSFMLSKLLMVAISQRNDHKYSDVVLKTENETWKMMSQNLNGSNRTVDMYSRPHSISRTTCLMRVHGFSCSGSLSRKPGSSRQLLNLKTDFPAKNYGVEKKLVRALEPYGMYLYMYLLWR